MMTVPKIPIEYTEVFFVVMLEKLRNALLMPCITNLIIYPLLPT